MNCYIHNISQTTKYYQGVGVDANTFFQIPSDKRIHYASDDTLLVDIANGTVRISSDGTTDISGVNAQIERLKGTISSDYDDTGRPILRTAAAQKGFHYQLPFIEFESSNISGLHYKDVSGNVILHVTAKYYKEGNVECSDQADADSNCIKTVIDFEPTHDYEIVGAMLLQIARPNQPVRVWVQAVPDVPEAYGGTKSFTQGGINLEFIPPESYFDVDGRASKYMAYSATYHTNKVRMIFKHNAGFKHRIAICYELFKP